MSSTNRDSKHLLQYLLNSPYNPQFYRNLHVAHAICDVKKLENLRQPYSVVDIVDTAQHAKESPESRLYKAGGGEAVIGYAAAVAKYAHIWDLGQILTDADAKEVVTFTENVRPSKAWEKLVASIAAETTGERPSKPKTVAKPKSPPPSVNPEMPRRKRKRMESDTNPEQRMSEAGEEAAVDRWSSNDIFGNQTATGIDFVDSENFMSLNFWATDQNLG